MGIEKIKILVKCKNCGCTIWVNKNDDVFECTKCRSMIKICKEMNRTESSDDILKHIKPYIDENMYMESEISRLVEEIDVKDRIIEKLHNDVTELEKYHEDSGLKRDVKMSPKWKITESKSGKYTEWYCPICSKRISNWENYCNVCGQKIGDRVYDDNLKFIDDEIVGNIGITTSVEVNDK